jgi:hypothetical protein
MSRQRAAPGRVADGVALLEGKERMRGIEIERTLRNHRWLIHVVLGYALAYLPLRAFSDDHWPIIAGFRMACLLLVPYRYWTALVLGETAAMIQSNMRCLEEFGLTWVVMMSIPRIVLAMLIMWWFRSRAALFPYDHQVNIKACAIQSRIRNTINHAWSLLFVHGWVDDAVAR